MTACRRLEDNPRLFDRWLPGIDFQTSMTPKINPARVGRRFDWTRNFHSISSRRCSMGFRSGIWGDHSSSWTSMQTNYCLTTCAAWSHSYPFGRGTELNCLHSLGGCVIQSVQLHHRVHVFSTVTNRTGQTVKSTLTPMCWMQRT